MPAPIHPNETAGGICVTCGHPLTQRGRNGECLRCLVTVGFDPENHTAIRGPAGRQRTTPGPLRYAHFEIETGGDGFPVELGWGAMAVTYRARDTVLNSFVALKVIDQTIASNPAVRTRFLREARAAAQLHHPNVARVSHYGEQDGECFYVMELVEGETLEARVRREGPMSLALALEVMEQAVRALAAAEAHGIVHRDIKPSNLMIETEASGATLVKVIDYGVAKITSLQTELGIDQTQSGFIGTPAFASPEQFSGATRATIDTRSDIYSFGATLWYLLSGRTPFVGRTLEELSTRQGSLPLEQLRQGDVPAPVLALLKSMLAIDPADRPQTARELLAAVHSCYLRFEPRARSRRRRFFIASSIAALLLAAAAMGAWLYEDAHSGAQIARSIAILPFENLSRDANDKFFAIGTQDEILTKLAGLADLKVISRTSTEGYPSKPADLKTIGRQLGVSRILQGSLQREADKVRITVQLVDAQSNTQLWANTYDRPFDDTFAVESEVANAVADHLNTKLAHKISAERPAQNPAAYHAYLRGLGIENSGANLASYKEAQPAYMEAVQLDPNFALAWARLSLVRGYFYINGIDRNEVTAVSIKEAAERALALEPKLGEAWLAQGAYRARVLRDWPGALEAYREAEKYLPNSSLLYEYMCNLETRLGRWRDAEKHLTRATELDPRNIRLWARTAQHVLQPLHRTAEAQAAVERALEIAPNDEEALTVKADNLQEQGRHDEADRQLARLPNDSTDPYLLNLRAFEAMLERKFDLAVYWTQQLTKDLKPGEPLSFLSTFALVHQGYYLDWAGRPEEARAVFERVIHEIAPAPGFTIPPAQETRSLLALAYAGIGDKQNALEQAHQAVADFENDAGAKPVAEKYLAYVQARCGNLDEAMAGLPHLLEVPGGVNAIALRYTPFWDPLRKDPRFEALVKNPPPVRVLAQPSCDFLKFPPRNP